MEHQSKTLTELPQDLVFNILGRLTCEELVPLMAVSKSLNCIVKGKSFTSYHMNNEVAKATKIILSQLVCQDQKITTNIYILDLVCVWIDGEMHVTVVGGQ